jgi:hypothetical protein
VCIALLLGALAAAGPVLASRDLHRDQDRERAIGARLIVLESASAAAPVSISRASCEALAHLDGVEAAGALVPTASASVIQLGPFVPVLLASPTLMPALRTHDAILGSELASERSATIRGLWSPQYGRLLAVTARPQTNGLETNHALVLPFRHDVQTLSECYAFLSHDLGLEPFLAIASARLEASGGELAVHLTTQPQTDAVHAFLGNPMRWTWVMFSVLGALFAFVTGRNRSSEAATYRLCGTSRSQYRAILLSEQAVSAAFFLQAHTMTVVLFWGDLVSPASVLACGVAAAFTWLAVFAALSPSLTPANPLGQAKER